MTELRGVVDDLSHDVRGVVRVDGKVYFVEGALPGEEIVFTRQKRHRRHEIGRLDDVVVPSPERVIPPCEYFGTCGGCALQHLASSAQVDYKQRTLLENLERIGHVRPQSLLAPITGPVTGYRRKARLGIRHVPKKGGVLVGFRERNKSYITSLAHCLALDPAVSALLPALHGLVESLSCYDRLPQIEVARGDTVTAMVFRHLVPLTDDDHQRLAAFATAHDVDVYLQPAGPDSVAALPGTVPRPLRYRLDGDLCVTFQPTDFVQVNATVNEKLVAQAITLLDPEPGDTVLELFCGIGNFSLPLARRCGSLVGVEASEMMVARATQNARDNGLEHARFVAADLYQDPLERLSGEARGALMFLDPPRSGALEVVRDLVPVLAPRRIVYVSCNPSTLARDAGLLVGRDGYRLAAAGAVDMFPHTAHVESIAVFER